MEVGRDMFYLHVGCVCAKHSSLQLPHLGHVYSNIRIHLMWHTHTLQVQPQLAENHTGLVSPLQVIWTFDKLKLSINCQSQATHNQFFYPYNSAVKQFWHEHFKNCSVLSKLCLYKFPLLISTHQNNIVSTSQGLCMHWDLKLILNIMTAIYHMKKILKFKANWMVSIDS